jgi:hypothetical protein
MKRTQTEALDTEDKGSFTNQVVDSNLAALKNEIKYIISQNPHLAGGSKERVGLEYIDNLDIEDIDEPFE